MQAKRGSVFRLSQAILVGLLLAVAVGGCTPPTTTTDQVRRLADKVWAGSPATNPPQVTDSNWHSLNAGDAVKTDGAGEAELQLRTCTGSLYVFKNAQFGVYTCRKSEQASGSGSCLSAGSPYFNLTCSARFTVDTPGARVTITGTAFSVTYLPTSQLTLVTVLDGSVTVQSVVDVATDELDAGIPVNAGSFLYTTPGPTPAVFAGIPAREPVDLKELPPLVQELVLQEPNILDWMTAVKERANLDQVLPPNWPGQPLPERPSIRIELFTGGGLLADPHAQEAVLTAVDKQAVTQRAFSGQDVVLISALGDQEINAYTIPYDLERARQLLAETGYPDGFGLWLVFPGEDAALEAMAHGIAENLGQVGISVEFVSVPAGDLDSVVSTSVSAGQPTLWLVR